MDESFPQPALPVSERVLNVLKRRGPQQSAELGACLGTTSEAARQQLKKLEAEGLVAAENVPQGVGRPARVWRLTALGHGHFPDAHADMTVDLIRIIRGTLGEPTLDLLIRAREAETRESYARALAGVTGLEARLARLAELRDREGYFAEWARAEDGDGWLLIENHCPICAAATACQGFCRSELEIFREMLGDAASIERVEHVPAGARRCVYRVRERAAA
ncbi:helix-turn-helix transcriptional regulator [Burkholderia gladioli]|uniref:helix-turn-helix transcriptional regulator n=1 Tax=Burkholderia gladioli TaxID=28095 RepID=UPI001641EC5E|nr:metalloregulator ArsR/SmtB family transcription factor [Burkholderia gladioli]